MLRPLNRNKAKKRPHLVLQQTQCWRGAPFAVFTLEATWSDTAAYILSGERLAFGDMSAEVAVRPPAAIATPSSVRKKGGRVRAASPPRALDDTARMLVECVQKAQLEPLGRYIETLNGKRPANIYVFDDAFFAAVEAGSTKVDTSCQFSFIQVLMCIVCGGVGSCSMISCYRSL